MYVYALQQYSMHYSHLLCYSIGCGYSIIMRSKHGLPIAQHSFKCFLKACIEFNNGLFHIFSGPLFANVEGYVYFDLLIWGLSPLTFLILRPRITNFLKQGGYKVKKTTLRSMLLIAFAMTISYFFLNYSPEFNWNYFSRTFNLDAGYFVFDMLLRTFDLIIDLQQEEEQHRQCEAYCEIQHAGIAVSYFSVFFIASCFEVNQRNNGPIIFGLSCIFSCISIITIPIIYFYKHKQSLGGGYHQVDADACVQQQIANDDDDNDDDDGGQQQKSSKAQQQVTDYSADAVWSRDQTIQQQQQITDDSNQVSYSTVGFFGVYCSLLLNMNYFSLWMMEPLGTSAESSYQQYNITIQMVSGFFMISTIGNYIGARMFVFLSHAHIISKYALLLYSCTILLIYQYYQVNYVSIVVLGFGFHSVCTVELGHILGQKYKLNNKFYLYCEIFTYFILPVCCTLTNIGQKSLKAYTIISGVFLAVGAMLV